jgi:hypothetical protein
MVNQRSVGLAIVLTLITCGIYGIYWFIVMTNDVGKLSGDYTFTGGKHFLLTLVTCGIWIIEEYSRICLVGSNSSSLELEDVVTEYAAMAIRSLFLPDA